MKLIRTLQQQGKAPLVSPAFFVSKLRMKWAVSQKQDKQTTK